MPTGTSLAYTGGTTHRPIPLATDQTGRAPLAAHHTTTRAAGLDFDALLRRCDICGQKKPGRLTRGACTACAPLLPTPAPAPEPTRPARGRAKRKGGARKGKPASPSRAKNSSSRPSRKKPVDEPAIVREYLAGESLRAVGARHRIDGARVRDIVTAHGHPIRDSRWSPEKVQQIVKRYTDGEPTTSLGREFNANAGTIANLLRANGVTIRPPASAGRTMSPHDVRRATELYREGAALAAIAEVLHIRRDRVRDALVANGIDVRLPGGCERVGFVAHRTYTAAVRAWAHEQGLLDRDTTTGRLPKAVVAAYTAAHPTTQEESTPA